MYYKCNCLISVFKKISCIAVCFGCLFVRLFDCQNVSLIVQEVVINLSEIFGKDNAGDWK